MHSAANALIAKRPGESYERVSPSLFDNQIPQLLTVREVAQALRLSEWTVRRWVERKEIPTVRPRPRTVRFNAEVIGRWLSERSQSNE